MSRWNDQFEGHIVVAALASTRQQLEAVSEQLADVDQVESHTRLGRVIDYAEGALKASDPELIPFGVLDQLAGMLNQVTSYLQQFAASPEPTFLDQANGQADAMLPQILALAPRVAPEDVQDLQGAVSTFRRSAGQHLRNIESEVKAVRTKAGSIEAQVTAQESKIEAQDARLDSVVTDYQAQFSQAQEQRQTQFSQTLEEGRAQLRENIEQSEAALKSVVEAATQQLDGLLEKTEEESEKALTELTKEGEARVEQLDELLAKAIKTVGAIGSTGMAGGYQIVANSEKKAADRWRLVAALALIGAIGATIFAVAHGVTHGFQVDTFFAKWAISIPFAALAGYAAHESTKHREQATLNRKIELQLASLDTYLVSLPQGKQDEIKGKLADRFFGELGRLPEGELETP